MKFEDFLRSASVSEPQPGLSDSSRVRGSEQQDAPTPVAAVPHDRLGALSGSASLTTLSLPMGSSNGESGNHHLLRLVASLHAGTTTLKKVLAGYAHHHGHLPRSALWLIGPEGDFSPAEMTAAVLAGFAPVTLGPLVLRSDTAAIYALSILSHELQGG